MPEIKGGVVKSGIVAPLAVCSATRRRAVSP